MSNNYKFLTKRLFSSNSNLHLHRKVKPSHTQLLINGKFVNSVEGRTFDTYNPSTEEKIATIQEAGSKDVDLAVKAAKKAFDHGPWRKMSAYERGRILYKLGDLIEANREELAHLDTIDNGKPYQYTIDDAPYAAKIFRYFAGCADKIHGQTIPISGPYFCYTKLEPVGVVGAIIPWNFPMETLSVKLAPALAAGCTVVLKPAEQTPLSALKIASLIMEAGFPEGVVNIIAGGYEAGKALCQHPLVDKITFTGSTEVGYDIMRHSHKHNLKRVTLELGGKSPNIIMDDADLDLAIEQTQNGTFTNSGQCCIAGSRVYVHEKIYDEFLHRTLTCTTSRIVGDPFSASTVQGAQIDRTQFDKILSYI